MAEPNATIDALAAQALTAPLAAAAQAVAGGDDVDVRHLLAATRACAPRAYPEAAHDEVGVRALGEALLRCPAALDGASDPEAPVVVQPAAPGAAAAAAAVLDGVSLLLEAKKLAHGLLPSPAALRATFATPDDARAVLSALARRLGGHAGTVVVAGATRRPPLDARIAALLSAERAVVLAIGPGAARVAALLTPSLRRLRVELALVGRGERQSTSDDDVYQGAALLDARAPDTIPERQREDATEGVHHAPGVVVVEAGRLHDELIDRRARAAATALRRARAVLVCLDDGAAIATVAGGVPLAGAVIVCRGDGASDATLVDGATGHVWPGRGPPVLSVPWAGVAPAGAAVDEGGFVAAQALARYALETGATVSAAPQICRDASGDSAAALAALGMLADDVASTPRR